MSWWLCTARTTAPEHATWLGARELAVLAALSKPRRRADWLLGRWVAKHALRAAGVEAELAQLEILADAARRHGALLAVNDRADIARAAGADVLHLGQDDLPLAVARDIVGPTTLIGRSTHETGEASRALMEDVDYFCVGPCWPTPTKPGRPAPGLELVRAVAGMRPDKPWFAIGGIDERRLAEVLDAGARRIVVVRAITAAEDPGAAAGRLSAALAAAG